jgi:hypothetical protein
MTPTQYMFPGGGFTRGSIQDEIYPPTEPSHSPSHFDPQTPDKPPKKRKKQVYYPLNASVIPQPDDLFDRSRTPAPPTTPVQNNIDEEEYPPTRYSSPNLTLVYNTPPRANIQPEPRNDEILVKDSFEGGVQSSPPSPRREIHAMNRFNTNAIARHGVSSDPARSIAGFAREPAEHGDEGMPDTDGESDLPSSPIIRSGGYWAVTNMVEEYERELAELGDESMPDTVPPGTYGDLPSSPIVRNRMPSAVENMIEQFAREHAQDVAEADMPDTDGESETSSSVIRRGGVHRNAANVVAELAGEQAEKENESMSDADGKGDGA